jgi:hypothetical protein
MTRERPFVVAVLAGRSCPVAVIAEKQGEISEEIRSFADDVAGPLRRQIGPVPSAMLRPAQSR